MVGNSIFANSAGTTGSASFCYSCTINGVLVQDGYHRIYVRDECSTADQISQIAPPIEPVVTPYDPTKSEVETVNFKYFFQDTTTY
jgi:hypothetical protein